MLTKNGANKILRKLMETIDMPEDLENDILRLQNDYTERDQILSGYGEVVDSEEIEEFDFKGKEIIEDDYKTKYESMKQKYLDRFFNGNVETSENEILKDNEDNIKEESEEQTFDSLFEKREG